MTDLESLRSQAQAVTDREASLLLREIACADREQSATVRERESEFRPELDALLGQLQEVNGNLIVANLRSQALADDAARAYQHVEAILNSITDAFCSFDHQWRCTQLNDKALRFLFAVQATTRSAEDVVGKNLWAEFPLLTASTAGRELQRAAREGVAITFEANYQSQGVWFEINAYPSPDGLSIFFRDVTERKAAEIARAQLAAIVDYSDDGITGENTEGIIQSWNKGAENIFGYTENEIVGSSISILMPEEERVKQVAVHHRVSTGKSVEHFESVVIRKGGARVEAAMTISPIKDGAGTIVGVSTITRDIGERKRAEAQAREDTERFRFLAESLPTKIFTATPDGERNYFNPQWTEFTGLTAEQLRGRGCTDCIHEEEREACLKAWDESIRRGLPFQSEHRLRHADGDYRWHLDRAQPMRDASGAIIMWIGSSTDIDEQKRTEENLSQLYIKAESLNWAKDEFLATLSHELRTPMTSILGWTALLAMGRLDEATRTEGIATIHRSAKAQAQLIDDVLDVSRMITGKLRLSIEPADMESILRAALPAIAPAAEAKALEIHTEFQPELLPFSGDPARLQQVFWNLLSNAVKFTPAGGRIDIRAYNRGSNLEVEIQDSGAGIKPEFLPFAFDRFAQQESGTMRHHGGMGIGLSIVKQLVELHGGTVSVASDGEGLGSKFTVSIPAQSINPRELADSVGADGELPSITGLRVLVVDDEEDSLRTIGTILEQFGGKVITASTASAALALAEQDVFDVLLCDIAMPVEDGYSLIRRIRASPGAVARLPAVALTAYGRATEREIAISGGFDAYLKKPVEPFELIAILAGAAARKL